MKSFFFVKGQDSGGWGTLSKKKAVREKNEKAGRLWGCGGLNHRGGEVGIMIHQNLILLQAVGKKKKKWGGKHDLYSMEGWASQEKELTRLWDHAGEELNCPNGGPAQGGGNRSELEEREKKPRG